MGSNSFWATFDTWLIEIKVRGARPHNRRALHAAWLIPRACGSRKSHEESQATSEPPRVSRLVVTQSRSSRSSRVHVVPFNGIAMVVRRHPSPSIRDMYASFVDSRLKNAPRRRRRRRTNETPVLTQSEHSPNSTVHVHV
jgi:hypothetical protein